jgi:hypothetical protein
MPGAVAELLHRKRLIYSIYLNKIMPVYSYF